MGLEGYGLEVGCNADLVILQAADVIKVLRLQPLRLCVVQAGTVIFRMVPRIGEVALEGRPHRINHPVRESMATRTRHWRRLGSFYPSPVTILL